MVLNTGPLDWEPSALTTRPLGLLGTGLFGADTIPFVCIALIQSI